MQATIELMQFICFLFCIKFDQKKIFVREIISIIRLDFLIELNTITP